LLTWLTISKSDRYTTFSKLPLFWIDYYFRKACVRWFSSFDRDQYAQVMLMLLDAVFPY
jgi:hypothetical protein